MYDLFGLMHEQYRHAGFSALLVPVISVIVIVISVITFVISHIVFVISHIVIVISHIVIDISVITVDISVIVIVIVPNGRHYHVISFNLGCMTSNMTVIRVHDNDNNRENERFSPNDITANDNDNNAD